MYIVCNEFSKNSYFSDKVNLSIYLLINNSHVANTYLHICQFEYNTSLYEENRKEELAQLEHTFRYQDDLLALNDDGLLESICSDIYPSEMIVNKTNISVRKTSNYF